MSRADEATNRAAQWIIAQEDGGWTDADQHAFDAWLAESYGNKAAYWRIKHSWREVDRINALGGTSAANDEPRYARSVGWWSSASIAASLLVAIGLGYAAFQVPRGAPSVASADYVTPIGGRRIIGLTDGSRIELNTASKLRTALSGERREVWLDKGEAYFEVQHLAGSPFIVHAGNRQVVVLGTKFSVRRDGERVTVSVVEGRVRVDEISGTSDVRSSIITGGDVAIAEGAATLVANRSEAKVESALTWREGLLRFDQMRLADVAAEFNRYNVRPIVVTDSEVGNIRIGGLFPARDSDAFVRLLRDAYGLKVDETATVVKISN